MWLSLRLETISLWQNIECKSKTENGNLKSDRNQNPFVIDDSDTHSAWLDCRRSQNTSQSISIKVFVKKVRRGWGLKMLSHVSICSEYCGPHMILRCSSLLKHVCVSHMYPLLFFCHAVCCVAHLTWRCRASAGVDTLRCVFAARRRRWRGWREGPIFRRKFRRNFKRKCDGADRLRWSFRDDGLRRLTVKVCACMQHEHPPTLDPEGKREALCMIIS